MHLIADAADVEDDKILAKAVDQAFELADHGCASDDICVPCVGLPPPPPLPPKGGGSKGGPCSNSPPPCGEGAGVGVSRAPTFIMPPPSSAAAWRSDDDARA